MMILLRLWAALLVFQEAASPPDSSTERRTGISARTLLPIATKGSIRHRDDLDPATNVDASVEEATATLNVSLTLDLGPFDAPTHSLVTLEINRIGFNVVQEGGSFIRGDEGEWLAIEAIVGGEWMDATRSRLGGGLTLGYHQIRYGVSVGGTADMDDRLNFYSVGLQVYGQHSLGPVFRIGAEFRAAYLSWGGGDSDSLQGTPENGHGGVFYFGAWLAWEPLHAFSLRGGYAVWKGQADWDVEPFLSSTTSKTRIEVTLSGPTLGLEFRF